MPMEELSRFFDLAFSGRAILYAGQDLEPGTSELLALALNEATRCNGEISLADQCATLSDAAPLNEAVKALGRRGSSMALKSVADVPWAAVFTSAIDDSLSTELGRQGSDARRLRHFAVDERVPAFFPRQNDVLSVLHLMHLADAGTVTGVPAYGRHWTKAQRLLIPGILRNLPEAIGPAHILCIAGISATDPVKFELVAAMAADLDPDNVYWFISPSDGLDHNAILDLAPKIHIIDSDLSSALSSSATIIAQIADAKRTVLESGDLTVTVGATPHQRVISFRAAELREFRRHLIVLPDIPEASAPIDELKRSREFINFLSENRQTPSWRGISEGYVFERDSYNTLLRAVLDRVGVIAGSGPRPRGRGSETGPIVISGPPASGRTMGLLWLGYRLRRRGIFTVQILPSGGMVDNGAIEQIIRLAEARGASATAIILDRTDRRIAENLDRHLRSAGRRTIVIASSAPLLRRSAGEAGEREDDDEEAFRGQEVILDHRLSAAEVDRFRTYLSSNSPTTSTDLMVQFLTADPALFAVLYRLIPDTRENIRGVLVDEYLQLVDGLASFRAPSEEVVRGSSLSEQLQLWLSKQNLTSSPVTSDSAPQPTDSWYRIATQLPQLVLLFSSLDEAISLNLLTIRFPGLLRVYSTLRRILESSGLFIEVALDRQNDIGLTAVNAFIARLLLDATLRTSHARLDTLAKLLFEFPWDPDQRPVDAPEQALLLHIIRSISPPSGAFQGDYQRTEDLRTLADTLRILREDKGATLPQLILIEGIVLRHLGRRMGDTDKGAEALDYYRQSQAVLEKAREILSLRRPSPGRNFEMAMVLNAIAATIGHSFRAESKSRNEAECKRLVDRALATASESRAYTDSYHPLDTAFWTNRDFFDYLGNRPQARDTDTARENALLSMTDALNKAGELGDLPAEQADRLAGRLVELDTRFGRIKDALSRAETEADQGRFSGVCLLARYKAIDSSNSIINRVSARAALSDLQRFAPRIMSDERALTLMHRLWIGAHLGNDRLDDGPHAIECGVKEWRELENIAAARRDLGGPTRIPYVNFWLAVAYAQQGDMRRTLQILEEVQANSLAFSHRRLTPLIYLSEEAGSPRRFSAIVRRRDEDDLITLYVPSIGVEVKLSKRYQGQTLMNLRRSDEATVLVALSYWNPVAVDPEWERDRSERMSSRNKSNRG